MSSNKHKVFVIISLPIKKLKITNYNEHPNGCSHYFRGKEKKTMHRYIKHLIKYFVLLVISIMLVSTFTTPIYAEGYDFDEGDPAAKGSASILGGPSWSRSGVVFYLVDEFGK